MSKELFMKAHEELIAEAMEADPTLTEAQAYTLTAAGAMDRMRSKVEAFYEAADMERKRRREEGL